MKTPLSFKDYIDSKNKLKEALGNIPVTKNSYEVIKYLKIPIIENGEKIYLSLKPSDKLFVVWEYHDTTNMSPTPASILVNNEQYIKPSWSNAKIKKWFESNTDLLE